MTKRRGKFSHLSAIVYSGLTLYEVAGILLAPPRVLDAFVFDDGNGKGIRFELSSSGLIVMGLGIRLAAEC